MSIDTENESREELAIRWTRIILHFETMPTLSNVYNDGKRKRTPGDCKIAIKKINK